MGKRALDLTAGTLLSIVLLPVMLVLAVAVAVMFRCWPLFVHDRVGAGGRLVRFPKLRSLPPTTPRYATYDQLVDDLPRFARFLRRTHLDELPQLFLVPLGRLSLVGPRPAMPEAFEPIDPAFRNVRLSVRPGCTCLWQVGPETEGLPSEAPEYDEFYVEHASWRLDLLILWWTALRMVGLGPLHRLDDVPQWARRTRAAKVPGPGWTSSPHPATGLPMVLLSPSEATDAGDSIRII